VNYPTRILFVISLAHMVNDLALVVIPPLLPLISLEFHLSHTQAGLILSSLSLTQVIVQPFFGALADKLGRRKLLMALGLTWFTTLLSLVGVAQHYILILILVFLAGLGTSFYHPLSTSFLSASFIKSRGRAFGIHGVGGGLGSFIAPILMGSLAAMWGWRNSIFIMLIPGVLISLLLYLIVKENGAESKAGGRLMSVITLPVITLVTIRIFSNACYSGLVAFLPTYFVEGGFSIAIAGAYTAILFASGAVGQLAGGWLSDRFGRKLIIGLTNALAGLFLFLFTVSRGFSSLIFLVCVGSFLFATWPVAFAFTADLTPKDLVATATGVMFGLGACGNVIGPYLAGQLADAFNIGFSYLILSILVLGGAALSLALPGKREA